MNEDNYPAWLADGLLNQAFNWNRATKTTFGKLLQTITLHDSYWYSTLVAEENAWILVINLDAFWNKEFCHQLTDWPFLLIKFQQVVCSYQDFTEGDDYYRTIGSAESGLLNSGRFAEWISIAEIADLLPGEFSPRTPRVPDLQRTAIVTIYGGLLSLIHAPAIEVLLYSATGTQLAVNLPEAG